MAVGTVKWFNAHKRHGFIKPDDGSNSLFVQLSDVEHSTLGDLHPGRRVSYEVERSQQGKEFAIKLKAV